MSYDHKPVDQKPILRVSETSKYFGKKKFKAGDYTKTDSEGRLCLYNAKHRFVRYLSIFVFLLMFIGCSKPETPKEYNKTTFTNYSGYWNYCHFGSNEIDPELKFFKSEKVTLFEYEVIKDTTFCKSFNCPRNGQMQYLTRITIE